MRVNRSNTPTAVVNNTREKERKREREKQRETERKRERDMETERLMICNSHSIYMGVSILYPSRQNSLAYP